LLGLGAVAAILASASLGQAAATEPTAAANKCKAAGYRHTVVRGRHKCVRLPAPQTTIRSKPAKSTGETTASFMFASNKPKSTFRCRLDDEAFTSCVSPKTYSALLLGEHHFEVRATARRRADPTPAGYDWAVLDVRPPITSIEDAPPSSTISTHATFGFSSDEAGGRFECQLDGGAFTACTSPKTYNGLAIGSHTFAVRAIDIAGNVDQTPAPLSWAIIPPPKACADGQDNDGDGKVDYPSDLGCSSAEDDTEAPDPAACSDSQDNDADGKTDYPSDPGCSSGNDTDEADPPKPPFCSDGIDNDADGEVDYPADPGCTSTADTDEFNPPPCHASYPTICLDPAVSDYDCAGGSGNGPGYVYETNFTVLAPDPYGLDSDHDGIGCET